MSASLAPAIRAIRGDQTPQQMTTLSVAISPWLVVTPVIRPPATETAYTSVPASTVSAPRAWARSRIRVPARSESTTPTVGKCAPPKMTDSSR